MTQSFATLGLAADIQRAIDEQGYTVPTPVQAQAIPVILEGRDVLAGAQTGTGKTAAFTLPMLHRLAGRRENADQKPVLAEATAEANVPNAASRQTRGRSHHASANQSGTMGRPIRALILTPTRELAAQVNESVRTYGKHLRLKSTMIYGGMSMRPQIDALRRGVDIVVATPGRLLDHVQQRTIDLSKVEFLVLDEADRMLDMGFIHDMRKIAMLLRKERQTVLFSATFSEEIRGLAAAFLQNPVAIEVARRNAESELVNQRVIAVDQSRKRELLAQLVSEGEWNQVLVFVRTKHGADRLSEQLCKGAIESAAIHGNKTQGARTRALADFKRGKVRVLVATDIAARGLDIADLPHVVNYELPNVPEDYVHRIGRTGRAGASGEAISLVAAEEEHLMRDIERLLKRKLDREMIDGFERTQKGSIPAGQARKPQSRRPTTHQPTRSAAPSRGRNERTSQSAQAPAGRRGRSSVDRTVDRRDDSWGNREQPIFTKGEVNGNVAPPPGHRGERTRTGEPVRSGNAHGKSNWGNRSGAANTGPMRSGSGYAQPARTEQRAPRVRRNTAVTAGD